jgi:hypothetical protein
VINSRLARWQAYFQTKNPNLGKFWRVLQWKMSIHVRAIWYIVPPFGIFYGRWVYSLVIWYIFPRFGMLYQDKSGSLDQLRAEETATGDRRLHVGFSQRFFCSIWDRCYDFKNIFADVMILKIFSPML